MVWQEEDDIVNDWEVEKEEERLVAWSKGFYKDYERRNDIDNSLYGL